MKRVILAVLCVTILSQLPLRAQQPLTLSDCRRMAIEHSETMRKADNAVRQAELDRQIAYANYLPKLDGSLMGLYTKDQDLMNMTLQMRGTYLAGLNLTQPLYAGGQLTSTVPTTNSSPPARRCRCSKPMPSRCRGSTIRCS